MTVTPAERRLAANPQLNQARVETFDWVVTLLSTWMLCAVFLDGWAHNSDKVESFFTPWHAVLYAGFAATAGVLCARATQGQLPAAYRLSLAGVGVFLLSGIGDLVWHTLFGIEHSVEALLSPTHLGLACGGALIGTGPLRAAAARRAPPCGWAGWLPPLLSAAWLLSVLTFFTQFANPLAQTSAARDYVARFGAVEPGQEVAGMLLYAACATGLLVTLTQRWRLPFGACALTLGLNATLMTLMCGRWLSTGPAPLVAAAALAGLTADTLTRRAASLRLVAAAPPVVFQALYFAALGTWGGGLSWSIHLWAGAIALAGVCGLLVSYLVVPPELLRPPVE
jgi:hypothetical protein